jgi:predicted phage terminase large subunit-like protein
MPKPTDINPRTGKRYNFVDPRQAEKELAAINAEIALVERAQRALQARSELLAFTEFTMPDPQAPGDLTKSAYKAAKFHKLIANVFDKFYSASLYLDSGEVCTQLIFVMPPRHGKTEMATKRAAAKYSGNHPEHNVAVASYSDTMAEDMGADTRAIMATPAFKQVFPAHKLRRGGTAKANIQTDKGGRLVFVGRGGALTGRGAHLLLIDDLFKDHEEARSQTVRDQAWNWFTKVAMTRRMGRKLVVITMTRWHSDDIIGRLTDPENPHFNAIEAKKWKIIRLPAIAEEADPLGRKEGEPLWPDGPDKFDLDFLQSQQRLDPLGFASLYQQRPTVADGVLFQRESMQFYRPHELPDDLRIYCASDHAVGLKQRNDPTVLLRVGIDKQHNIYLLDCFWKRAKSDAVVEAMLMMAGGNMRPLLWWAEKGHISQSIGPFLYKRMEATQTYFSIKEVTPVADKEQRAQSIAGMVGMGKVYFPKDAIWTEKAINEMLAFPNGTHDDFVDALAYIGLGLRSQHAPQPPKQPEKEPKFGTLAWVKRAEEWQKLQDRRAQAGGF